MKTRILCLFLTLLLLTACSQAPAEQPAEFQDAAGQTVQDAPAEETAEEDAETSEPVLLGTFSAETLSGETVTEAIFADADLTVINVWATYCGPCKVEMPVLGKLDRELDNVQVLGIVTDVIDQNAQPDADQIDLALDLLEVAEAGYPNLILNESLAMLGFASLTAVPATLFVDSEGYLVGAGFYGALDEESWRQVIGERLELAAQ